MHQLVFKDLVDIGEQCNRATMFGSWFISLIVDCHFEGPFACCIKQLNSRASGCDISLDNLLYKCRLISAWPTGLCPWNSSRFFSLFSSLSFPLWTFWLHRGWCVMPDDNQFRGKVLGLYFHLLLCNGCHSAILCGYWWDNSFSCFFSLIRVHQCLLPT